MLVRTRSSVEVFFSIHQNILRDLPSLFFLTLPPALTGVEWRKGGEFLVSVDRRAPVSWPPSLYLLYQEKWDRSTVNFWITLQRKKALTCEHILEVAVATSNASNSVVVFISLDSFTETRRLNIRLLTEPVREFWWVFQQSASESTFVDAESENLCE